MKIRCALLWTVLAGGLAAPALAQPATSPAVRNPAGVITLGDAVSLALLQSPDLAAFDWGRRAAEARQVQAGRRPNPVASMTLEDVGGTHRAADPAAAIQPQATIQLSHLVELGGKRAARQALAAREQTLADIDYEAARLDVLSRVTTAFHAVLAGQDAVTHTTASLDLARQVRQTVAERVAAGVVSPIEETRADILLALAQVEVDRARRTLDARRRQLSALWGHATPAFGRATGDLAALPALPALETLSTALAETPDVARWTAEVEARQAALEVARSAAAPDLTASAGYRRFTSIGSQTLVVGVSVSLPWFNRNRDGIRAADANVSRARAEANAAALHLQSRLAEAYRALASAGDDVQALRARIVPGAQSVFEAVREGYQLGRFGLMDVLDAQRTLATANRDLLAALTAVHQAAVTVERLVGRALTEFTR
jgi:cobalt-zinc-cadmium efflux system outer membrane protein